MIIFSQGVTSHSRIANSLLWMSKLIDVLHENSIEFVFPWGLENFGAYLSDSSDWMKRSEHAEDLFKRKFGIALSAVSVSEISAKLIGDFYLLTNSSYEHGREIVYEHQNHGVLFINGKINFGDKILLAKIKEYDLVFCHEPYDFSVDENFTKEKNYSNLIPRDDLFVRQLIHVNSLSNGKKNIGFHVRRGDYKEWQGGKYYYDDDFWIEKYRALIADDLNIWIFTNQIDEVFANKLNAVGAIISNGSFEEDFVRMMFMSEIYGPPSTFPPMALEISKKHYMYRNKFIYLPGMF